MNRPFASLHARTFCHATESPDKVKTAMQNTVGIRELKLSKTEGHHGNPITVMEVDIEEMEGIDDFFSRLSRGDFEELLSSLSSRIDEGCNLFLRIDKQEAFRGTIRLGKDDDVISVRIHVRSFPSKCAIATSIAREYLAGRLS